MILYLIHMNRKYIVIVIIFVVVLSAGIYLFLNQQSERLSSVSLDEEKQAPSLDVLDGITMIGSKNGQNMVLSISGGTLSTTNLPVDGSILSASIDDQVEAYVINNNGMNEVFINGKTVFQTQGSISNVDVKNELVVFSQDQAGTSRALILNKDGRVLDNVDNVADAQLYVQDTEVFLIGSREGALVIYDLLSNEVTETKLLVSSEKPSFTEQYINVFNPITEMYDGYTIILGSALKLKPASLSTRRFARSAMTKGEEVRVVKDRVRIGDREIDLGSEFNNLIIVQ